MPTFFCFIYSNKNIYKKNKKNESDLMLFFQKEFVLLKEHFT